MQQTTTPRKVSGETSATWIESHFPHPGMGFREFVALVAALMAVNALAIDTMLPALPAIGASIGIVTPNARQWIVTSYLLGFGSAQLVYGPLSDRFGRKSILLGGLVFYAVFSVMAAFATSFETMMTARVLQGFAAAATRVLAISIVRDSYSGRPMARVMSLSFIVFLAVPIVAPSIGQLIMLAVPWQGIFGALALFALAVSVWVAVRLPETLRPENRASLAPGRILRAFAVVLTTRISIGYTIAMTLVVGGLFGFINSAQQVFVDVFHQPAYFTLVFALVASFIAAASLINATLVGRFGTRVLSHGALVGYIVIAIVHAAIALAGRETIVTFAVLQSMLMFCFGLVASNFGAMAMEPLGRLAGTASSAQGFISTVAAALFGFFIGQQFDGTVIPLTLGFAAFGIAGLAIVVVTERGRLFRPTEAGIASEAGLGH